MTLLVLDQEPRRYPRTAARWLARYVAETPSAAIGTAALVAHHLAALERPETAAASARALAELFDAHGRHALAETLRRWQTG